VVPASSVTASCLYRRALVRRMCSVAHEHGAGMTIGKIVLGETEAERK